MGLINFPGARSPVYIDFVGTLDGASASGTHDSGPIGITGEHRDSADPLDMVLSNIGDVVLRYDPDGTLTWASPSLQAVLGFAPDEVVGTKFDAAPDVGSDPARQAILAAMADHGDLVHTRALARHRDGSLRWMAGTTRMIWNDDGSLAFTVACVRDVTDEVSAQADLAAARAQLQATLDSELDPHVLLKAVRDGQGQIIDVVYAAVNPAAERYFGVRSAELVGQLLSVKFPHHAASMLTRYIEVIQTGQPLQFDDLPLPSGPTGEQRFFDVRGVRVAEAISLTWRDVSERHKAAQALAESERLARLLAENSSDFVMLLSPEGVIEWVSPSVTTVVGWQPEEVVGHSPADLYPTEESGAVAQVIADALSGQPAAGRRLMLCADGSLRWVLRNVRPISDDSGNVVALVSSFRDIQAEVEAETALREAEQRYRSLVASLGTGVLLHDNQGRILEANAAAEQIIGLPLEVMRGQTSDPVTWRVVHADGSAYPADSHPTMLALRTGEPVRNAVMGMYRPDGSFRWLITNAEPLRSAPGAAPDGVVASFSDITELQEARRALAESEDRYRLLAENASDVVFRCSTEAVLEWVSPAAREMLGWPAEEMIGLRMTDYVHPDDLPVMRNASVALDAGEPTSYEARFRRAGGGYRWLTVTARTVYDNDGRPIGRVGSCRDATADQEARAALEFLATHDSLTNLINRAELLNRLNSILSHEARRGSGLAVLFGDFDGLKAINDAYGHGAGDAALIEVARRITSVLRAEDIVARIGGDEYVVALLGVADVGQAEAIAAKIHACLEPPLEYQGHQIGLAVSLGITLASPGSEASTILRQADLAGYRAKRHSRNASATYDPAVDREPAAAGLQLADGFAPATALATPHPAGLLDRRALYAVIEGLLASPRPVGLVALGVDPRTDGGHAPDAAEFQPLLACLADRVVAGLDSGQYAGQLSGRSLAVAIPGGDLAAGEAVARRLREVLATPLQRDGRTVEVSISAGVAVSGSATLVAEDLVSDAEYALLLASRDGSNGLTVYTAEIDAARADRATLAEELASALELGQFRLAWQDIRSCRTEEVMGREALIRWQHPTRGLLAPSDFLPTLLSQGLGVELARFVIDEAARQWSTWAQPRPWVAVNMSAPDIGRGTTMRAIRKASADHGIPAEAIVVELTEQTMSQRTEVVEHGIELAQSGVRLALDDFGAGSASIGDLQSLPIAILKLDRSLLTRTDERSTRIAGALVSLAHSLEMLTVAEGVETQEHLANARRIGADLAQGYLLGRPQFLPEGG